MTAYQRGWFNAGRSSALAGLPPLPPSRRARKAREAYIRGYSAGGYMKARREAEKA